MYIRWDTLYSIVWWVIKFFLTLSMEVCKFCSTLGFGNRGRSRFRAKTTGSSVLVKEMLKMFCCKAKSKYENARRYGRFSLLTNNSKHLLANVAA